MGPSRGVALIRPGARESPASAPADLRLLFDHSVVEVGTITGDYLKRFHGLPLIRCRWSASHVAALLLRAVFLFELTAAGEIHFRRRRETFARTRPAPLRPLWRGSRQGRSADRCWSRR